jgi:hypothetical protein
MKRRKLLELTEEETEMLRLLKRDYERRKYESEEEYD